MPKTTKPRRTWKYSREFKLKVIKLSLQPDTYIKDVAQRLDIHPFMLSRWRKAYREGLYGRINQKSLAIMTQQNKAKPKKPSEIERLRQENDRLKMENDLLKKWQWYLAEEYQHDLDSSKDTEK